MNFTLVKICGLTRAEDAVLAASLGAWAVGFIFYQKSPRFVDPSQVKRILEQIPDPRLKKVGVFVNSSIPMIENVVRESGINSIQLHGDENVGFCAEVKKKFPHLTLIKAIKVEADPEKFSSVDFHLIDSQTETARGGTGITVDWKGAAQMTLRPILLAGGLTPQNVKEAIRIVRPDGVDVSSGVETSPGVKSALKMKDFFKAIKGTS